MNESLVLILIVGVLLALEVAWVRRTSTRKPLPPSLTQSAKAEKEHALPTRLLDEGGKRARGLSSRLTHLVVDAAARTERALHDFLRNREMRRERQWTDRIR